MTRAAGVGGKVRVVIATSIGPSTVLRLGEEDPQVRSVACLRGTPEALPISGAYDAFVRNPTGVVERAVGHPAFRVDLDAPVDDGDSWQLGLYLAHRLKAAGRLAEAGEPAEMTVWATGTVDRDLAVGPVERVADKLRRSASLLAADGDRMLLAVPTGNRPALEAAGLPARATVMLVGDVRQVLGRIGVETGVGRRRTAPRLGVVLAVVASAMAMAAGAAVMLGRAAGPPGPELPAAWDPARMTVALVELRPTAGGDCDGALGESAVDPGMETAPGVCRVVYRVANGGGAPARFWLAAMAGGSFREYVGGDRYLELSTGRLAPGATAEAGVSLPRWIRGPMTVTGVLAVADGEDERIATVLPDADALSAGDLDTRIAALRGLGVEVRTLRHTVRSGR